jgi:copper(I)-binding protein
MVSRETSRPLRRILPAAALGFVAALGIVGCSAGQVAQTAAMEPAVNGNSAQVGDIALRDVLVSYPDGEHYETGDDAPLLLTIINSGGTDDELVGVSSPAGEVELIGNPSLPGRTALQVVLPGENPAASTEQPTSAESSAPSSAPSSATSSTPASETGEPSTSESQGAPQESESATPTGDVSVPEGTPPALVGTMSIVIKNLTAALPFGKTVPVTFEFAKAGKVTVHLPVASPSTPRAEATEAAAGER